MKSQAAVLYGVGQDRRIETIDLDPPRTGEVLVNLREGQNIRGVIDFATA